MRLAAAVIASLLAAVPARASAPRGDGSAAAFAVAYGGSAFAVVPDPGGPAVLVRKLGLDGGVLWEDRWSQGRGEVPVGAAVAPGGGLSVAGDDSNGCWAAQWSARGIRLWNAALQYGAECHTRTVLTDANGNTYVLATTTVGGGFEPTVWMIDRRGSIQWTYRLADAVPRYAFALALAAAWDGVTVTTAVSGPAGWVYDSFDVDSAGRRR